VVYYQDAPTSLEDIPPPINTKILDVNLTGTANSVYLAFHYLRLAPLYARAKAFSKVIVVVSSFAGYEVSPLSDIYGIAKYGVRGLWKCTKGTAVSHGIRMNLLAPGYGRFLNGVQLANQRSNIPTPMISERAIGLLQKNGVQLGTKEDVTDAMFKLVADESVHGNCSFPVTESNSTNVVIGRAICTSSRGNFDLRDDHEGLNGGIEQLKLVTTNEFGAFGQPWHYPT
jgi:NAD(P)-dependent dehydrogenase (short-subunit alcohol dehydrogenase family)